jgi:hypothetical protein
VNKKNRTGLWLSVTTLVLVAVLIFVAYNRVNFVSASAPPVAQPDPLDAENGCWECHQIPNPEETDWYYIYWYCHNALPAESYASREYLRLHLAWVIQYSIIPPELYTTMATQMPPGTFQLHLFNRALFPALASITVGTTVTWTNMDVRDYTLQSQSASLPWPLETVTLKPGESISYTFEQVGVFSYAYQYADLRPVKTPVYQSGYGKIVVSAPK